MNEVLTVRQTSDLTDVMQTIKDFLSKKRIRQRLNQFPRLSAREVGRRLTALCYILLQRKSLEKGLRDLKSSRENLELLGLSNTLSVNKIEYVALNLGPEFFKDFFKELNRTVRKRNRITGRTIIIDGTALPLKLNHLNKQDYKEIDPEAEKGKTPTKGWFEGYKSIAAYDAATGLPLTSIEVPGNEHEVNHLEELVDKLQKEYGIEDAVILADKGFISQPKLQKIFRDKKQYLVTALRSNMAVETYLQIDADLNWFTSPRNNSKETMKEHKARFTRLHQLYRNIDHWMQIRSQIEHAFGKIKDFFSLNEIDVYSYSKVKRRWLTHQWAIALVDLSAWKLKRPDLRQSPWKLFK